MKLKLKNLITGLAVFLLGILLLGSIPTEAATKKITITPATTKDCYDSVYVNITSPLKKSKNSSVRCVKTAQKPKPRFTESSKTRGSFEKFLQKIHRFFG